MTLRLHQLLFDSSSGETDCSSPDMWQDGNATDLELGRGMEEVFLLPDISANIRKGGIRGTRKGDLGEAWTGRERVWSSKEGLWRRRMRQYLDRM